MNLIGCKVKHIKFGTGTVIEQEDPEHITVEFESKTSTFQYPLAFEKFLQVEDEERREEIMKDLNVKEEAIEAERAAQTAKWMEAARKVYEAHDSVDKKYAPIKRIEGTALTYFVFQGGFFDLQAKGGYLWAPIYNAAGDHLFYWDNIMNIREGDVIFHADGGYIKAISRARGSWYEYENPHDIFDNPMYKEGRRVDLDVTLLSNPIRTSDYKEEIVKYCNVKYAPFDKNGDGNRGYLYDIDPKLVSVFLKGIIKENKDIMDLDYIQWLI